ncbi:MAG: hypothetical protein EP330_18325 [Deltaproteobacteria bacterium]|nr:MAG: hypothetical protein EP330_18325 [Deltaproteobacteria bacterium]
MTVTRRHFLVLSGSALAVACARGLDLGLTGSESFDEMLDLLHTTAVDFDNGLSNHAPMAAEALVTLGAEGRAVAWVAEYSTRLETEQDPALLAQVDGLVDQMTAEDPQTVLEREVAVLANGFIAAGWHGVLRTAHAVRSLMREDTPSRRRELAFGLAYWQRDHATFVGTPGSAVVSGTTGADVLAAVPLLASGDQVSGRIPDQLAPGVALDGFAETVASFDIDAETLEDAIHGVCAAVARAWVTDGRTDGAAIVYLHGITGTSCLRLLLPWLTTETARSCLGFAVQSAAAAIAAKGTAPAAIADDGPAAGDIEQIGSEDDDEHTIKLAEAVLRELDHADSADLRAAFGLWERR